MLNQIISSSIIILVVLSIRSLCGKYIGQRMKIKDVWTKHYRGIDMPHYRYVIKDK